MKLVLPVGRDKMVTAAEFDVEPRFGCACSYVNGHYLTDDNARIFPPGLYPFDCQCSCSFGDANEVANQERGFNSNEW